MTHRYLVAVRQVTTKTYIVSADSPADARKKYMADGGRRVGATLAPEEVLDAHLLSS